MSEKIKVTIVMDDEKQNMEADTNGGKNVIVTHDPSMTLMSTLLQNNLVEGSFCGGRGDCGRCMVQFMQGIPLPTPLERSRLEAQELRQGYRLACLARPKDDCVIKLMFPKETKISIVTEMIELSDIFDFNGQRNKSSKCNKMDVTESGVSCNPTGQSGNKNTAIINTDVMIQTEAGSCDASSNLYIVAVDLGTTTIAMRLRKIETGEAIDTYCEMNPQRKYGADVLSRIQASCEGHREALKQCVWSVLERGMSQFAQVVEMEAVKGICIAGNTTMGHLLLGYEVSSLGKSPFTPVDIGLQECKGPFGIPLYITPGISAFVGGDIVAGLYVLGIFAKDKVGTGSKGAYGGASAEGPKGQVAD